MKRIGLIGATIGALMAAPSLAQTYQQPVVQRDTVPVQITQEQIKTLQRTLNTKGFSAGKVDGLWGPDTAAALKRFQAKNELNATGELDRTTELKLGMIPPSNQLATPAPTPAPTTAPALTPASVPSATTGSAAPAAPLLPVASPVASSATTRQPKPTSGANSFTDGQAHDRIQGEGYQDVRNLTLDPQGIWRGMAIKNGQPVHVWLDFQGDVGQQ